MKKISIALFFVTVFVTSCSKKPDFVPTNSTTTETEKVIEEPGQTTTSSDDSNKALTMMKGSDCFACHKEDAKLLGPSWQEIANKYTTADAQTLATHIIDGSTGIWGELQMTPHANISNDDALTMVEYILTLKTN